MAAGKITVEVDCGCALDIWRSRALVKVLKSNDGTDVRVQLTVVDENGRKCMSMVMGRGDFICFQRMMSIAEDAIKKFDGEGSGHPSPVAAAVVSPAAIGQSAE